jgi:cobalt-zinc-cadmium efflux system outer membrane protein
MKKAFICSALLLLPLLLGAQAVSYTTYMQAVARDNATLLAERYNVEISAANLRAARVFNDPELSLSYSDNQDRTLMMGRSYEAGLSYEVNLGGLRRARIGVAATEQELSEAALDDYLRQLRAEASYAWSAAWAAREHERIHSNSYEILARVARADSLRAGLGEIRRTEAAQSALEALTQKGEWMQARAEYQNALSTLSLMAGGMAVSDLDATELPGTAVPYGPGELMDIAELSRADLKAAELSHTLSQKNLALVRASRAMDLGLELGYAYNTEVRNEIAPAPIYNALTFGVTIPLKFSSLNRGERAAAEASVSQAERYLEAARQLVRTEVQQAWTAYQAARDVAEHYSRQMVGDARGVLEGMEFSYTQGDATLLELLTAVQTSNDVALAAADAQAALFDAAAALRAALGVLE